MFRTVLNVVVSLVVAAAALAQSGVVVSVDTTKNELVIKVAEQQLTVNATKVDLLDKEGKAAKLADFAAKDRVMVTMDGDKVTKVQRAAGLQAFALAADDGSVVRVDTEHKQIVVKVGAGEHTVGADKVKLLDKNGKPAKLSDFAAGDKVKVTFDGENISTIQHAG